jgi:hypothetical protein
MRRILFLIIILFLILQVFQPSRNTSSDILKTDIANMYNLPDSVEVLFINRCYDCHSNNSEYPWFTNIQPIAWFVKNNIEKGKSHLNFSNFGEYDQKTIIKKLNKLSEVMRQDKMPIKTYKWYYKKASLNSTERILIANWAINLKDSLERSATTNY